MAVLSIAGSGRRAGKTAVACALMAATPELRWVAVKISPHEHESASPAGLWEETDRESGSGTGRYLAAGAHRAILLAGEGEETLDVSSPLLAAIGRVFPSESLLLESNRVEPRRVAESGEPCLCLAVIAGVESEWKPSLRRVRADAVVLSGGCTPELLSAEFQSKRMFCLPRGRWMTEELARFVRRSLRVA